MPSYIEDENYDEIIVEDGSDGTVISSSGDGETTIILASRQGPEGRQGATGPQGATGAGGIGYTGATGPQGLQGTTGATGAQGATGSQGATGADGNGMVAAAAILLTPSLTPEVGDEIWTVTYQPGADPVDWTGGVVSANNDFVKVQSYEYSGLWDADPNDFVLLMIENGEQQDYWPTVYAKFTGTGFEVINLPASTLISLSCGGAGFGVPAVFVGSNWDSPVFGGTWPLGDSEFFQPQSIAAQNVVTRYNFTGNLSSTYNLHQALNAIDGLPLGATGATGPVGETGPQGATGPQGETGATGPIGATGAGATGATGPQGNEGLVGATGATGPAGNDGWTGPQGETGPPGIDGATGPQGETGPNGLPGNDGWTGPQGETGATGPQGATGASALWNFTGSYSIGASYAIGDVATYGGQTWYRIDANGGNVGDTPSEGQFWTLLSAIGEQGVTGPQGIQGNEGLVGASGATGPAGSAGLTGETGATGPQGIQGVQGFTGAVGATGSAGSAGATGATGPQGSTGPAGTTDHGALTGLTDDDHLQYQLSVTSEPLFDSTVLSGSPRGITVFGGTTFTMPSSLNNYGRVWTISNATGSTVTLDAGTSGILFNAIDQTFDLRSGRQVEITLVNIAGVGDVWGIGRLMPFPAFGGAIGTGDILAGNNITITPSADNQQVTISDSASSATKEPMGHANKAASTISFDNSTRIFSISPVSTSFDVWNVATKYTISSTQTVTLPTTTGLYYIYFENGTLGYQTTFFNWESQAPTAYIYWNNDTGKAEFFADERHGITLDWATHEYLHRTRGAAIASGFGLTSYTTGGDGSLDAHAQISMLGGTFFDEDLQVDIVDDATPTANTWEQSLSSTAQIPVFYRSGTGWVKDTATNFPLKQGSSRIQRNVNSSGNWISEDIQNNHYVNYWIVATNNLNSPVLSIMGQNDHSGLQFATEEFWEDLDLFGMPVVEIRPLYRLTFKSSDSYSNTPKATLEAAFDVRNFSAVGQGSTASIVGPTGPTGATGPAGATGAGTQGFTGATGPAGTNGTNGADGATGATGPAGSAGAVGATGAAGAAGSVGATGPQGTTGPTGVVIVYSQDEGPSVLNTATPTSLLDSAPTITGVAGDVFKFRGSIRYKNDGSGGSRTFSLNLKIGATTVISNISFTVAVSTSYRPCYFEGTIRVEANNDLNAEMVFAYSGAAQGIGYGVATEAIQSGVAFDLIGTIGSTATQEIQLNHIVIEKVSS